MNRKGKVLVHNIPVGIISEEEDGYQFKYFTEYIGNKNAQSVSLSLPLQVEPFINKTMFPFFDGLIPEGWLLDIAQKTWKLNPRDRMGLLLACCRDCIGAVSVIPMEEGYK